MLHRHHITRIAVAAAAALVVLGGLAAAPAAYADSYLISPNYLVQKPDITCVTDFDAAGNVTAKEVDLTTATMYSPRSNQAVSYIATVWEWTASGWGKPISLPEQFGNTNGVLPNGYHFTIPASTTSYYRVSVVYRYWWNGQIEKSANLWAGTHLMFFEQDTGHGTAFQYGDSGDWCHMNVNQAV
jgi:hypothetical protein